MTADDLVALFRKEVQDQVEPFLWDDDLAYSYADDAQKMLCRNTELLLDATSAFTQITIVPGDSYKPLDNRILRIRYCTRTDTGYPVEVLNFEDLLARGWYYSITPDPTTGLPTPNTGMIRALVIGEQDYMVRTFPISNELTNVTLQFAVFRLPLNTITTDDNNDTELEVPEQHHRHLTLWMKALAYGKQDAETLDAQKQQKFETAFEGYCAKVKLEQQKQRHKTRVVQYGGLAVGRSSSYIPDDYGRYSRIS